MAASDSLLPGLCSDAAVVRIRRKPVAVGVFRCVEMIAERIADFLACGCAAMAVYALHVGGRFSIHLTPEALAYGIFIGSLTVVLLEGDGAYRATGGLLRIGETEHAIRVQAQIMLLILPLSVVLGFASSIEVLLAGCVSMTVLLVAEKQAVASILHRLHARGFGAENVVIYGAGETGFHLLSMLQSSGRIGLRPAAVVARQSFPDRRLLCACRRGRTVPVRLGPLTPQLLAAYSASVLIVAETQLPDEEATRVAAVAKRAGVRVATLLGSEPTYAAWAEHADMDPLPVHALAESPIYAVGKRLADVILSSLLLTLLAPVFLLIALLIRVDSPGPAFFVQTRVGKCGARFRMWKFRSMYANVSSYERSPRSSQDRRITGVGRVLRKTSLDELPQLINVFFGEMSLVGPRPEMPFIAAKYSARQRQRLQVTPGITGLWQLSPSRSEPIHHNLHYDLFYIRNRNFFMDIAILLHTALFAMRGI